MRGLTRALGVAAALLAAAAPAGAAPDRLVAGAARVEVALPAGVPLAGYGGLDRRAWLPDVLGRHPHAFWLRPSRGVLDPFVVRALHLAAGPVEVDWLAVDLVGVDPTLVAAVAERLGGARGRGAALLVSASHTHSGPGAFADSELLGFAAVDRASPGVREAIVAGMARAVREARAGAGDAAVAVGRIPVPGITVSRLAAPLDHELGAVQVRRPDGRPVAVLWNYAIHGTVLPARNLHLSGDVTGRASAIVERMVGAPALYVNGAVADVSPLGRGRRGLDASGAELAAGVRRALAEARPVPPRLAVARARAALPAPSVRLGNCVRGWAPEWLAVGLGRALPSAVDVLAVAIGSSAWVTVPGELQTSLGLEVKRRAGGALEQVFVAGLTNDYLGYFLTRADYARPSYIACASLYGERGGEVLRDAAHAALERLRGEAAGR